MIDSISPTLDQSDGNLLLCEVGVPISSLDL